MLHCPRCYSEEATGLGRLGLFKWVRCRDCGTDYHIDDWYTRRLCWTMEQRDRNQEKE